MYLNTILHYYFIIKVYIPLLLVSIEKHQHFYETTYNVIWKDPQSNSICK